MGTPPHTPAQQLEALISRLLSSGALQQALDTARDGLEKYPDNVDLCNLAGMCAAKLGDAIQAEQLFEHAIAMNPQAAPPCFNLGLLHAGLGRMDKAEWYYRRAVELNPGNVDALINLGALLTLGKHLDEAEQCCRRVIELSPGNAAAYSNLGLILEKQKRFAESQQCHRNALSLDEKSIACRFNLANYLAASDQYKDLEEAKSLYIEIIRAEAGHIGALNNLGSLLFNTGYTSAAQTAYSELLANHPREITAHVNIGHIHLHLNDLPAAKHHFNIALEIKPDLAVAHQGLASIYQRQGDEKNACIHRNRGFGAQPLSTLPYRGKSQPIQLLILASALEGNIPWQLLVDGNVFETTIIAVEYFDVALNIPAHDLIFNAIGDADLCHDALMIALQIVRHSPAPAINHPSAVLQTGRLTNVGRLNALPGVIVPRIAVLSQSEIVSGQALVNLGRNELKFPLLLRATGFHGGNYFLYVEDPDALQSAAKTLPGENLFAIEFLDSRSQDTLFRKYRVMFINGNLYPVHMAISAQWKVHYFSSDMGGNSGYRSEEELFLSDFSSFLGDAVISSLEQIRNILGLDYCGIDFGVISAGKILLYEANSTMVIHPPGREEQWNYRRTAIERALTAAKNMFLERATSRRT